MACDKMTHFLFVNLLLAAVLWTTDASTFPVMYSLSSTVTAVRGSDVKLVCKGSNVQPLDTDFMWKFNTETVENKKNRNTKVTWLPGKRAKYSLDILNVSEKDVGDYRCIAQVHNLGKTDKAEASIKLRLYESILNLKASPPNVIIEEGRTAPLQCEVMCSEAMDVWTFWLFNGKMIEARPFHTGNEYDLSNTVTNISTLVLKNAMLSQTGVYTCGANSTGLIKTQNITVTVTDLEGPTLVQTKSNIDAVDGENITLSCNAVYPEAFFVDTFWIFNGSRINSNDKYKEKNTSPWLEQSEQSVKRMKIGLTIYNVGLNDSGEYICALNTSLSLQLKNVSVKVRRRLGTEIPPDLSSSTEGDNGNGDVLQTSLCIGLGVFVGLLMIIMISLTLWRRSRPRPPQSSKQI
ncbi:unnamed protein product [Porites lobata]|uniref:Ig-like domain-containing protein n=1 Tax=Porites lobata TaxID=104759 RepID=A0ABN8R565_9CNID|nr:unnamed protein product [Porites lobata]